MNIVGESFSKEIAEQIIQRQKIYGSINRNNNELVYLNTKTGYCKLMSGVYVTPSELTKSSNIRNLNIPAGIALAQNHVLWNGMTAVTNLETPTIYNYTGIATDGSVFNNGAYGFGGLEFGIKPMPGIISAEIKTETRGSIKRATVKIQANNRTQFDIIDLLYMRLGYSVLLEWGQSSYFNNSGEYISKSPKTLTIPWFTGTYKNNPLTYDSILGAINDLRLSSYGNYDALFAKVVNFNWTFTKEGKYDITINLISLGDVVESLKANILLGDTGETALQEKIRKKNAGIPVRPSWWQSTDPYADTSKTIESYKDAHEIGKYFYISKELFDDNATQTTEMENKGMELIVFNNTQYTSATYGVNSPVVEFIKQEFDQGLGDQYYVRFGNFLKFLEEYIVPNIDFDVNKKLIKIDYNTNTNIAYVIPDIASSDPKVCYVKNTIKKYPKAKESYTFIPYGEDFIIPFNDSNIKGTYGYVMNIYFNMIWILLKIDELKDDEGKISIYDLINTLCKGFNESTGNFNKLEPVINSDTNLITIVDDVALPDKKAILKSSLLSSSFNDVQTEPVIFDTYRYTQGTQEDAYGDGVYHAGFVKDLSFNTTVSPELATMITVGSTKHGYIKGQDATALSRMNNGLEDRFKKTITDTNETAESIAAPEPLEVKYKSALNSFKYYLSTVGVNSDPNVKDKPNYDKAAVEDFKNTQTQLVEYYQAQATQTKQLEEPTGSHASPNAGFLPFDLSLSMDGLSGMKVYQSFLIDTDFMPTNYPSTLEFLIKGITHKIENDQWTTNIESMAVPKDPFAISSSISTEPSSNTAASATGRVATSATGGSNDNNYPSPSTYSNVKFAQRAKNDGINPNLLEDINTAAINAGLTVTVTTAVTGHKRLTSSGNISSHWKGIGVDVAIIDNIGSDGATSATNGNATFRTKGNKLKDALVSLGYTWNKEVGQEKAVLWQTNIGGNHFNHLHISKKT